MLAAAGGMKSQPHPAAFIGGSRIKMLERLNQSAHRIFPPKTPPRVIPRAPRGLPTPTPRAPPAPRDHALRTSLPSRHHTACAAQNTAQPPRASRLPRQNRDSHGIVAVATRSERGPLKHRRCLAACQRCCREVRHRCHTATNFLDMPEIFFCRGTAAAMQRPCQGLCRATGEVSAVLQRRPRSNAAPTPRHKRRQWKHSFTLVNGRLGSNV